MKRSFDVIIAALFIIILLVPIIGMAILVKLGSPGPVLFWSNRVGQHNRLFSMPKFRTMRLNAPNVATHLLDNPDQYQTSIGSFLRKFSLDELPQLYSILMGKMSFVGPRPALFNQDDLIQLRTQYRIHELIPGLTGWAQINGRDELPIVEKVKYDYEYLLNKSFKEDIKILWMTLKKVILKEGVSH
jgi:O-antigen biosynthesis protein WbqP